MPALLFLNWLLLFSFEVTKNCPAELKAPVRKQVHYPAPRGPGRGAMNTHTVHSLHSQLGTRTGMCLKHVSSWKVEGRLAGD